MTHPPTTKVLPTQCFPHRHMKAVEYAIYDVCRAMASRYDGVVFFSGPQIAKKFLAMSRNTPYKAVKALERDGWFVEMKKSGRRSDGTRTPTHYRVLTHDEWCALHPDCCPAGLDDGTTGLSKLEGTADTPSQFEGQPSQSECNQSQFECEPSQKEGTNLYKTPIQKTHTLTDTFVSPSNLEVTAFIEHFGKRKKRKAEKAEATSSETQPFPQSGTDVLVRPRFKSGGRESSSVVSRATMANLGFSILEIDSSSGQWDLPVLRLLNKGYNGRTIAAVAEFYRDTCGDDVVRRERAAGFEVAFPRLLNEMNASRERKEKEAA